MSKIAPETAAAEAASADEIRSHLLCLLDRLDDLQLFQAGAHLSMAIHCLDSATPEPRGTEGSNSETSTFAGRGGSFETIHDG